MSTFHICNADKDSLGDKGLRDSAVFFISDTLTPRHTIRYLVNYLSDFYRDCPEKW